MADNPLSVSYTPELGPLQVKQEAEETPEAWWRSPAPGYMRRCQDLLVRDIKTELREVYISSAKEVEVGKTGRALVVFFVLNKC